MEVGQTGSEEIEREGDDAEPDRRAIADQPKNSVGSES